MRVNGGGARIPASFDGAGSLRLRERVSQVSVRLRGNTAAYGVNGRPWAAGDYICREGDRFVDAAIEAHRKMQRSPEKLHSRARGTPVFRKPSFIKSVWQCARRMGATEYDISRAPSVPDDISC